MIDISSLIPFAVAVVLLALTPGPDMLYIMARSAGQGRKAGVVSALGVGLGIVVHTIAAAIGLSAILMASAHAYDLVKYAGAIYLIYLGIRMFLSGRSLLASTSVEGKSLRRIFTQAIFVNILNPKVALFFLAFLPVFVNPSLGNVTFQFLFYGTLFNVIGSGINIIIALLAGTIDALLRKNERLLNVQRWATGGIFIALGLRLAFFERD